MVPLLSSTNAIKAAAATGAVSAAQAVTSGTIEVPGAVYTIISIGLALVGVHLSRMVTIEKENLRLGRRQSWRETGPLTWIAVLIVCPFIWHFKIAIPWASLIGLGTGYSVRIILALLGAGATSAARGFVRQVSDSLRDTPAVEGDYEEVQQRAILDRLDQPEEPTTHDRDA